MSDNVINLNEVRAVSSPSPARQAGDALPLSVSPAAIYEAVEQAIQTILSAVDTLYSETPDGHVAQACFDNRDDLRRMRDRIIEIERWCCKPENRTDIEVE